MPGQDSSLCRIITDLVSGNPSQERPLHKPLNRGPRLRILWQFKFRPHNQMHNPPIDSIRPVIEQDPEVLLSLKRPATPRHNRLLPVVAAAPVQPLPQHVRHDTAPLALQPPDKLAVAPQV